MTTTAITNHQHVTFDIHSIPSLLRHPDRIPDVPGVYAALFPQGIELLARWGYFSLDSRPPSTIDDHPGLDVGMTAKLGIAQRIDNHIRGDARVSSLRMSLGALLRKRLRLSAVTAPRKTYFHFGDGEARLSSWMADNVLIGIHACDDPATLERSLIHDGVFPLNITDRRAHPFSRQLVAKRRDVVAGALCVPGWPPRRSLKSAAPDAHPEALAS
jgi:hypothetical protein